MSDKASIIARIAHDGQEYDYRPYYERHLCDVVARVAEACNDLRWPQSEREIAIEVAFLHDVIEDTLVTAKDLRKLGFCERTVEGVVRMTHDPSVKYNDYVANVCLTSITRLVKRCDMEANLQAARSALSAEETAAKGWLSDGYRETHERRIEKWEGGLEIINNYERGIHVKAS